MNRPRAEACREESGKVYRWPRVCSGERSSSSAPESSYAPAIASPPRNGFNGSNLNPPSLAIIIVIVVTAFFLMGFFTIYIHQCAGGGSSTTSRSHRRGGLDPEIIDTFPTFLYSYVKDLKIGKGALECAVCLSEFEDEVTLRWLPKCDHVFHPDCIDSWLASHSTCPLCRSDLSATTTTTTPPIFSNNEQEVEADQFQNTSQSPSSLTEINNNLVNETAENSGRVRGRFRRWHTTGHTSSVVVVVEEGCDDCERFTLRLPEEVRRQIVESTAEAARMKRAKSCVDERGEGSVSSRRWWGRGEDRDRDRDKWLFFSRGASVKSPKITDGEGSAPPPRVGILRGVS
ncbi:hypothetical protein Sjap_010625 [Stephania japonica]|uniref:RING-type E3 ubiquitin transferase n=1 Tax=Stephania japonica TaxID=461633 RepID=A0AAP0J9Y4_9MAGN